MQIIPQTLTVLPAVSNPPTLNESSTFQKNVSALANLNNRQLLAIRILAKVYTLNTNGGTDYRNDFGLLVSSATRLFGSAFNVTFNPIEDSPENLWEAVLDWSAGYTATNTLPTDVNALLLATKALVDYPEATLYQIILFLRYKLAE